MATISQVRILRMIGLPFQSCPSCGRVKNDLFLRQGHGYCRDCLPVTLRPVVSMLKQSKFRREKRRSMVVQPVTLTLSCKGCGTQYRAERKSSHYCSTRCRVKAQRQRRLEAIKAEAVKLLSSSYR
jgi:hypothetical protein